MDYLISAELYRELAARLREAIGISNYFSGTIRFQSGDVECLLRTSVVVYRRRVSQPDGEYDLITNLVPVWWELHTAGPDGELLNDLDFRELTAYVIEN